MNGGACWQSGYPCCHFFNADAQLLQPLTGDAAALAHALDRIAPAQQTCLPCAVQAAAELAKAQGITFFTIALGADVDDDALAAIAAPGGRYFARADATGLADMYAAVAVALPCPVDTYWGRR